jgi:hypothetical protein
MEPDTYRWIGGAVALLGVVSAVAWYFPDVPGLRAVRNMLERLPKR